MNINDYEQAIVRFDRHGLVQDGNEQLAYVCGLCAEAGEVAAVFEKAHRKGVQMPYRMVVDELGDVLFFMARLAASCGTSLEDIAGRNFAKLTAREAAGTIEER